MEFIHNAFGSTPFSFANAMEKTVDIPTRLNMICAHFDITLNRLATKSGAHYNTLLLLRDGVTQNISGSTVKKICAAYPVRDEFVQYGRGEMLTTSSTHYENVIQQMAERIASLEEKVKMQEAQIALYQKLEKANEETAYLRELQARRPELEKRVADMKAKKEKPTKK